MKANFHRVKAGAARVTGRVRHQSQTLLHPFADRQSGWTDSFSSAQSSPNVPHPALSDRGGSPRVQREGSQRRGSQTELSAGAGEARAEEIKYSLTEKGWWVALLSNRFTAILMGACTILSLFLAGNDSDTAPLGPPTFRPGSCARSAPRSFSSLRSGRLQTFGTSLTPRRLTTFTCSAS